MGPYRGVLFHWTMTVAQQKPQAGPIEPHQGQVRRCVQGDVGGARMAGVSDFLCKRFGLQLTEMRSAN